MRRFTTFASPGLDMANANMSSTPQLFGPDSMIGGASVVGNKFLFSRLLNFKQFFDKNFYFLKTIFWRVFVAQDKWLFFYLKGF